MRVGIPSSFKVQIQTSHPSDKPSNTLNPRSQHATKTIVPAGHGHAFSISKNSRFRITDLHGEQVVDLFAWVSHSRTSLPTLEKMSMAYTRYHLRGVTPNIGEHLYSNANRPLLTVVADTVKVHDMTFMACFPSMYTEKGLKGHRSCAQNVLEAMERLGMRDILEVPEPFNCFQNTPNYSLKGMGSSKPGDYVEFEAEEDLVVAVSCCPYDVDGFNGGKATDVEIAVCGEHGESGECKT